jgi:hypothetical protein
MSVHGLCDRDELHEEQELLDWVQCRQMERAETIAEVWGTHAVLRFPWHSPVTVK